MLKLASIIIPVYNGEKYLEKCIKSALEQTYNDYEIVIVDNNSIDTTKEIALNYEKMYPEKIRYVFNEGNTAGDSHNAGILNSTSKYICFLHADDTLKSDYLEKMIVVAEKNESDMVACGMCMVDINDNKIISSNILNRWQKGEQEIQLYMSSFVLARLFRRDFLLENDIFFPSDNKKVEDMPFITQCGYLAKNINTVQDILYNYSFNSESVSHDESYHNLATYDNTPIEYIKKFAEKMKNISNANDEKAYEYQLLRLCWFISNIYIRFAKYDSVFRVNRELADLLRNNQKNFWKNPYKRLLRKNKVKENTIINRLLLSIYSFEVFFHLECLGAGIVSAISKITRKR